MGSFRYSSPEQAWQERRSLAGKQSGRRELDRFFCECLAFMGCKAAGAKNAGGRLSDAIAAVAFKKFGALSPNVMRHWGIDSPEELGRCFCRFLKACSPRGRGQTASFSESEALKALFRGDFWP